MSIPQSQLIKEQIAEHEFARAAALRAMDDLAAQRPALLLSPADKASDRLLSEHDAVSLRERRAVERAEAHLAELRPALEQAEAAERKAAQNDLFAHGCDLVMEYRRLAETEYLEAAKVLADVLLRLDNIRFDAERVAAALDVGQLLAPVEAWRRQAASPWRLHSLPEAVRLPALMQGARPIWDADFRKPAVRRPIVASQPQDRPAWNAPPISITRPNEAEELRKIEARAEAERRARRPSLHDIGRSGRQDELR